MIKYFKDYNDMVMKPYGEWIRKHWIGYFIVCPLVSLAVIFGWIFRDSIKDTIEDKFGKKEEEF